MKKVIILLGILLGVVSCSDDNDENSTNNQRVITLNEVMTSDSYPVTKTEKFLYDQGRLMQHTVRQTVLESEINYEVNLIYSDKKVTVASEMTTLTYTLNAEGYASQCIYNESDIQQREYKFAYSADGYLTEVIENINGKLYSTITLTYNADNLESVTSHINDISNKVLYKPGEQSSQYYIPCLSLLETHPFTLHTEALYAGLLGKAPHHFTVRTTPEGNDSEYTTYTYQVNKEGNLTQIHSQTTYLGGDSYNYYPNRRTVSISYSLN